MAAVRRRVLSLAAPGLDCLDEDAGGRVDVVAGPVHPAECPSSRVVQKRTTPLREETIFTGRDPRFDPAAAWPGTRQAWMACSVAGPPARLMRLGDRDSEKRPAVLQQGSPDDRVSISQPRPMDNRTPPPPAVATLTMDDLPAAGAELAVIRQGRRPDSSDDLFGSPERGPLLVRMRRDDPPVTAPPVLAERLQPPLLCGRCP